MMKASAKSIGFDVLVNGKRVCRALRAKRGVVSVIVTTVRRPHHKNDDLKGDLTLEVGGYFTDKAKASHLPKWVNNTLEIGDEISIRIIKAASGTPPKEERVEAAQEVQQLEAQYLEAVARKYGWVKKGESRKRTKRNHA